MDQVNITTPCADLPHLVFFCAFHDISCLWMSFFYSVQGIGCAVSCDEDLLWLRVTLYTNSLRHKRACASSQDIATPPNAASSMRCSAPRTLGMCLGTTHISQPLPHLRGPTVPRPTVRCRHRCPSSPNPKYPASRPYLPESAHVLHRLLPDLILVESLLGHSISWPWPRSWVPLMRSKVRRLLLPQRTVVFAATSRILPQPS